MSADSDLKRAVLDELELGTERKHIGATANAGVVTLTGHVENYSQNLGAEKATSRVKGMKAVAEEISMSSCPTISSEATRISPRRPSIASAGIRTFPITRFR
jgi:osmotically-inducible protein OsmY